MGHAHGTFCFAELHTPDVEAAKRFYGTALGWTAADAPGAGGAYALFQRDGRDVAALRRADGRTRWIPYLSVENVDGATVRAQELRATIVTAPYEMAGLARLSVIHDPAGGIVGLWEPAGHAGAAVVDEPGSMWWVELLTRDVPVAKSFYSGLLGWNPVDTLKYGIRYSVFKLGNDSVAGLLPIGPDPIAPHWQVLFAVDDCDAGVERAKSAGGSLVYGPNDIPNAGRAAVVADTRQAPFVLMKPLT